MSSSTLLSTVNRNSSNCSSFYQLKIEEVED